MKKYLLLWVAMLLFVAADAIGAAGKLSSYTSVFLQMHEQGMIDAEGRIKMPAEVLQRSADVKSKGALQAMNVRPMTTLITENGVQMVESFVVLADGGSVADVEAAGAVVTNEIGDMLIAKIPVDAIETLAGLDAVERISISRPVRPLNDVAREVTHTDVLHAGSQTDQPYTGEGVIVGIVDSGIDYNHIDFKDGDGNSRVVRAYCEGKTYATPEDIAGLTTDDRTTTHGTHVAGTAAGSYTGNGLQGMAPGADLYLCGLGASMTTSDMIARADEVVSYAREVGKPVVINFSLGSNTGPKLGTDEVAMALDEMADDGVIFVIAAGNEGDVNLYINKPYNNPSGEEQFKTMLMTPDGSSDLMYSSATCYTRQPSSVQFVVVDTSTGNEVYESEVLSPEDGPNHSIRSLGRYFTGMLSVTFDEVEDLQEIAINPYILYGMDSSNRYRVAVKFYGEQGDEMNMWSDGYNLVFDDGGDPEFTAGTSDCSINEMATGSKTISVGAYTTKLSWTSVNTQNYNYTDESAELWTMASFSSYGRDMHGVEHPVIVAPGFGLASAFNRYATTTRKETVSQVTANGDTYSWGMNAGTSMACPVVTGIIATWLQRNPSLNVDDIKYIFAATAQKPEKFGQGVAAQWGPNGLIDAYAGWGSCAGIDEVTVAGDRDEAFIYPNPTDGRFRVIAQGEDEVSIAVYSTSGALMLSRDYVTADGRVNVDVQGELPAGIYVLKLQGDRLNYSGKLVIR